MRSIRPDGSVESTSIRCDGPAAVSAAGPAVSGWLLTRTSFGWPLLIAGTLKIVYDLLLLAAFRHVRPPEEAEVGPAGRAVGDR